MEGKELYDNEDEEFDSKSKKQEEDADDFGLPEIEDSKDTEEKPDDLGDPYTDSWEEKKEEDESVYADSTDDFAASDDTENSDYIYDDDKPVDELDDGNDEYKSSYYEEEYGQKKSPIGWIIFGVIVVIAIIIAVFLWLNREEEKPVKVQSPKPAVVQPAIVEPEEIVEEVVVVEEPVQQAGVFEINEPTGRYHVIVASSIDKDLVHDFGEKLAKQGMTCNILAPRGNKKFHRLSVADYVSLNDAALKSEQLKSTLGEEVWVIRY